VASNLLDYLLIVIQKADKAVRREYKVERPVFGSIAEISLNKGNSD